MHTVKEGRIRSHFWREGVKKAGSLQQHINTLIDVAHKDHRGIGRLLFFATGKGAGSHIVFHDLNAVFVLEANTGNFIKGYAIPKAYQAHCVLAHVIEEVRNGRLPTGNQNTVRRNLFVEMRFTSATRPKLTEVEVVFDQRDHPEKKQPFLTIGKLFRLHAD